MFEDSSQGTILKLYFYLTYPFRYEVIVTLSGSPTETGLLWNWAYVGYYVCRTGHDINKKSNAGRGRKDDYTGHEMNVASVKSVPSSIFSSSSPILSFMNKRCCGAYYKTVSRDLSR